MSAPSAASERATPIDLSREAEFWLGPVRVRPPLSEYVVGDQTLRLQPRVMQVLVALVRADGEVVSRDDLVSSCWRGLAIGDDAIQRCIGRLRRLAEEEAAGAFAIETLTRIGYRLSSSAPTRPGVAVVDAAPAMASSRKVAPSQGRDRPRLAVLAFAHPSDAGDEVQLAEAIAEEVIAGLSRSRLLTVIARQSSLNFDTRGLGAAQICAELAVDYIFQGQVRRSPSGVRISAHLMCGRDDQTVWSGRYDRPLDDLFAAQDEISAAIVSTVEPALLGHEEARALRAAPESRDHWDLFMIGRWHFWRSTLPDSRKAKEILLQALTLKPDDAPTLSLLAHCCLVEVWGGTARDPRAAIAEAHQHALRAVHLDGSDAFAHFTLGVVLSVMGRPDQEIAEQRRAIDLNPNLPAAHGQLGRVYAFAGQVEDALACSDRAIKASPNDPHLWLWLLSKAIACFVAERHDEAAEHAAAACAIRPDYFFLHFLQAACAAGAGRLADARVAMDEGLRIMPRYTLAALKLGHPFAHPEHMDRYVAALRVAGWREPPEPPKA